MKHVKIDRKYAISWNKNVIRQKWLNRLGKRTKDELNTMTEAQAKRERKAAKRRNENV